MDNEEITLRMTPDEINLVLEGLGNLPFVKVYVLIGKIQEQAHRQLRGAPASGDARPTLAAESGD